MKKYLLYLFGFLFTLTFPCFNLHAERLLNETKILCGFENGQHGGKEVYCDITTQKCIRCKQGKESIANKGLTLSTLGLATKKVQVYQCISQSSPTPSGCETAVDGGLKGDEWTSIFFGMVKVGKKTGQNCVASNFVLKYSNCYGCIVVQTLTSAFVKAAGNAYDVSKQAANVIVIIGMLLWLSMFALKNVSSFATLEPMKIVQEFFVQCFKVILAMVIINSGLKTIMDYTLVPIMSVGSDIADTISASTIDSMTDNLAHSSKSSLGGGGGR